MKVLLVDGDDGIRKSLSLYFKSRHYYLDTAENSEQAIKALKGKAYDVILCDYSLPDMPGMHFFRLINDQYCKTIKILLTVYGDKTTTENNYGSGIDYLFLKPFSGEQLEETLLCLKKKHGLKKNQSEGATHCPGLTAQNFTNK